jgi:formiminoglutamate deiminase
MYELAGSLTPESMYAISRIAFRDLAQAGVLCVGEFHYVHHDKDGTPYADRTVMSDVVIRAARDEGLRISLLRVLYARGAPGKGPQGAQRRFVDPSPGDAFRDIEELRARYRSDPDVRIGIAPHSVRAVPASWLREIAAFAGSAKVPVHMHVAEQPAEIDVCVAETSKRPVELLADVGLLNERFVAVHATHLAPHEAKLLGDARSIVCLCPTTERDLGDGLADVTALRSAGVALCTGVDSHVLVDPFEDARAIELGERLRTGRRITDRDCPVPAERLWESASEIGARAIGFEEVGGMLEIWRGSAPLALVEDQHLLDAIVFSGSAALVRGVVRPEDSSAPDRGTI